MKGFFMALMTLNFTVTVFAADGTTKSWWTTVREIAPNSLAAGVSSEETVIRLDERPNLITTNRQLEGQFAEVSRLTSSLSLTTMPLESRRRDTFDWEWVPVFTFAFRNLAFESQAAFLEKTDFQMLRTSAGLGPELSLNSRLGTFYVNVTPGVAYSWISWASPVSGGGISRANFNLTSSVGYTYTFTSKWALRVFIRDVAENTAAWKTALETSQGFQIPVVAVNSAVTGFTLSRRF